MSDLPIIHTASNEYTEGEQTTFLQEIKRLEAALRWYANPERYMRPNLSGMCEVEVDAGQVAREALGEGNSST